MSTKRRPFFPYPEARLDTDPGPEVVAALDLGRRRCVGMLRLWGILQSADAGGVPRLPDLLGLLACAYVQGVNDAVASISVSDCVELTEVTP